MPERNTKHRYQPDAIYHVYNRGVEKREIFLSEYDYEYFLQLLDNRLNGSSLLPERPRYSTQVFGSQIQMLAYCLMPNHYHFLLHQHDVHGITRFMRSLNSSYVRYFNYRYHRVGPLYQGKLRAVEIRDDNHLVTAASYIHRNPLSLGKKPSSYKYSNFQSLQESPDSKILLAAGGYKNYRRLVEVRPLPKSDPQLTAHTLPAD